jgi:hypothetical protein
MPPASLTIEILKQIRDDVRGVSERVDATRSELRAEIQELRAETRLGFAQHGQILAQHGQTLAQQGQILAQQGQALVQHGQAIVKLVHEVARMGDRFDNFLLGAHQKDHADLADRVARLESKIG